MSDVGFIQPQCLTLFIFKGIQIHITLDRLNTIFFFYGKIKQQRLVVKAMFLMLMQHKLYVDIVILNTYNVNIMWFIFFNRLKNPSEHIWIHLKLFVVKSEVWEPSGKGVLGGVIPHAHLFSFLMESLKLFIWKYEKYRNLSSLNHFKLSLLIWGKTFNHLASDNF